MTVADVATARDCKGFRDWNGDLVAVVISTGVDTAVQVSFVIANTAPMSTLEVEVHDALGMGGGHARGDIRHHLCGVAGLQCPAAGPE
jgi:hypothetical protein